MVARLPLALLANLIFVSFAFADIKVGAHLRWGYVVVSGKANPGAQTWGVFDDMFGKSRGAKADFTLTPLTAGTSSDNGGEISGRLNQKMRVRAGQYEIDFSNMKYEFEVSEGETRVIKLKRVVPAYIDATESVTLRYDDAADDDDDSSALGRWESIGEESVPIYYCERPWFGGRGPVEGGCAEGSRKWVAGHRRVKFKRSWSSAVFYVLPGTYAIKWNLKDGSTHRESKIRVN